MSLTLPDRVATEPEPELDEERPAERVFPLPPFAQLRSTLPTDRLVGWTATVLVTAIAGLIRMWGLAYPRGTIFDEVYYATEAREILNNGGIENNPGYMFIVHPPLGKWLIASGEWFFTDRLGWDREFGWRFPSAVAGTLAVLILVRVTRRITGSTLLGSIAGLLLALDGLSVVQSRVALLDIFLQTFIIAGFACLVLDRDMVRRRLGRVAEAGKVRLGGPSPGPRPWRLAAGVLLGLACGVKWSGIWFLAGFAVLSVLWDRAARRSAGVRQPTLTSLVRDLPGALFSLLVVPVAAYLATWTGWFLSENGYNRHWADTHPGHGILGWLPGPIRSLLDYHRTMWDFHKNLSSPHPYSSKPWAWIVDARPISYYYPSGADAPTGCGSTNCVREVLAIGTPALWWAFVPAVLWMTWILFSRRDWRAGAVLMAFLAGWASWLTDTDRTMFFFYMTPLVPFLVLGVTLALGDALGTTFSSESRRLWGLVGVCAYLALVVVNFVWIHPVLVGNVITYDRWHQTMWFGSWI